MRWAWTWALLLVTGCLVEYTVGGAATDDDDDECPAGQERCHGDCVAAGACDTCPEGQVLCDKACVAADACPCETGCDDEREMCADGLCVCRTGLSRCGSACVDIRADAGHCGGCGEACDEGMCDGGECAAECSAQVCGDSCVEVAFDSLNCGQCGEACESDEVCLAGECRRYTEISGCTMCPCEDACDEEEEEDESACCDAPFLGGPVCVRDGCG